MATYTGIYDDIDINGNKSVNYFTGILDELIVGAKLSTVYNGIIDDDTNTIFGSREKRSIRVELIQSFLSDDIVPIKQQGIKFAMEYTSIQADDGDTPPRRYPLELSWRSPVRK
ncbi:hypothetical protein D3C73_1229200 [compost metagenome]